MSGLREGSRGPTALSSDRSIHYQVINPPLTAGEGAGAAGSVGAPSAAVSSAGRQVSGRWSAASAACRPLRRTLSSAVVAEFALSLPLRAGGAQIGSGRSSEGLWGELARPGSAVVRSQGRSAALSCAV